MDSESEGVVQVFHLRIDVLLYVFIVFICFVLYFERLSFQGGGHVNAYRFYIIFYYFILFHIILYYFFFV